MLNKNLRFVVAGMAVVSLLSACASTTATRAPAATADALHPNTKSVRLTGHTNTTTIAGPEVEVYLLPDDGVLCAQALQLVDRAYRCVLYTNVTGDISHAALVSETNHFQVYHNQRNGDAIVADLLIDRIEVNVYAKNLESAQDLLLVELPRNMDNLRLVRYIKPL